MRLRLNLIYQENIGEERSDESIENFSKEVFKFLKIVFPVNLKENYLIKDLKLTLSNFLKNLHKTQSDFHVENLCLNEFFLLDEFEINQVLNNDDELR
jgi:hypothetical protein